MRKRVVKKRRTPIATFRFTGANIGTMQERPAAPPPEPVAEPFFSKLFGHWDAPPPETLGTKDFKNCCGINIIYGFPGTSTSGMGKRQSFKTDALILDLDQRVRQSAVGCILIALNEDQVPLYNKILEDKGFYPCVKNFYHMGHNKNITLYARVNHTNTKKGTIPEEISSCGHRDKPSP